MKTIRPGSQGSRAFTFDKSSVDVDARTVNLAFSSEQPARRWFGDEILDHSSGSIRLGRFENGAPLLIDHNNSVRSQPGIIESVSIGADRIGRAVVRFGKGDADEEIFQKVQDGIIRNVSVGYIVHRAVLEESTDDLDTYRILDWEPVEASLVSVPLDASVGVGRAAQEATGLEIIEIKSEVTEMGDPTAEPAPASAPVDNTEAIRLAVESARKIDLKRQADIMTIGKDHAQRGGVELASKAIQEAQSLEDFQRDLLVSLKAPVKEGATFEQGARVTENSDNDGKRGFTNLGHFCQSVRSVVVSNTLDPLLSARAATTFANEGSGPDGGYAVPPEFAQGIADLALGEESLLAMTDNLPVTGNSMSYVKDEGTPWGSTGIQATWQGEAAVIPQTKPVLDNDELKLKSLKVLVPATEELLADSTAMSTYITRKMGEKVDWKVQDAIVNGNGSGMPLGITASSAVVSQAKEGSQAADTIVAGNVAKMIGRVINGAGANQVWLINPDSFNQIITLSLNSNPIWTPPSEGFKSAPSGFLLGRRIIQTDACQTLGDLNDIILANMAGYRSITKAGGAEFATSMHMYFDQNMAAFRLIFRMDGGPMLTTPVTPPNSTKTRSHFVALAARA